MCSVIVFCYKVRAQAKTLPEPDYINETLCPTPSAACPFGRPPARSFTNRRYLYQGQHRYCIQPGRRLHLFQALAFIGRQRGFCVGETPFQMMFPDNGLF